MSTGPEFLKAMQDAVKDMHPEEGTVSIIMSVATSIGVYTSTLKVPEEARRKHLSLLERWIEWMLDPDVDINETPINKGGARNITDALVAREFLKNINSD